MTPFECAKTVASPINNMGSKFMMDPATFTKALELDNSSDEDYTRGKQPPPEGTPLLEGMNAYFVGRFGVLGDVHSDIVTGAAAFINPQPLGEAWSQITQHINPRPVSEKYYASCAVDWGRQNFEDSAELKRFCELAERVVGSASAVCAPIFAGWRSIARPDDAPGAAELLLHTLRELRFARHIVAVAAAGMSPVEAILTQNGESNAQMFMWPEPYPDISDIKDKRVEVEEHTNRLSGQDYAVLSDEERAEFADIVTGLES